MDKIEYDYCLCDICGRERDPHEPVWPQPYICSDCWINELSEDERKELTYDGH